MSRKPPTNSCHAILAASGEDFVVEPHVLLGLPLLAEVSEDKLAASRTHSARQCGVVDQNVDLFGQVRRITHPREQARLARDDEVGDSAGIKSDDRRAAGQGFKPGQAETFLERGNDEQIGGGIDHRLPLGIVDVAYRVDRRQRQVGRRRLARPEQQPQHVRD